VIEIVVVVATSPVVVVVGMVVIFFYWKVQLFQKCVLLLMLGIWELVRKNFIKQTSKTTDFLIKI
jgi:hypothetical protein